jgi:hypothetical protein
MQSRDWAMSKRHQEGDGDEPAFESSRVEPQRADLIHSYNFVHIIPRPSQHLS